MIVGRTAVKHSPNDMKNRPRGGHFGIGRRLWRGSRVSFGWLDGWWLLVPSAGLAIVAAALAVPRPTAPKWVPQPLVHPSGLATELMATEDLAAQAREHPLPYAIRELGEVYRRLGRSQYELSQPLVGIEVRHWQGQLRTVQGSVGNLAILRLRALQCQLLVAALRHWQRTGNVNDDLIELGGDLVRLVRLTHAQLTEPEQWALALKRWTTLAGVGKQADFRAQRDLELTQLHFFYEHPPAEDEPLDTRVRILKRYADLDPAYPGNYALGVLYSLNGRIDPAISFFAKHLETHPDGAFSLRARNHLIWAARQLASAGNDGHS